MALSLGLLAVVALVLVGMYGGVTFSPGGPSEGQTLTADVTGGLQRAAPLVGFPVIVPATLPAGWQPNSFSFTEQPGSTAAPPAARAGWLTEQGRFISAVQSRGAVADVLTAELGGVAPDIGTQRVADTVWTVTTGRRGEQAWYRTDGDVVLLITGTASADDFRTLAATVPAAG